MAELGHPVIGPQSMWKLTKAELRIYAEGFYVDSERRRLAREDAKSDSSYGDRQMAMQRQKAKEKRDDAALDAVEQQMNA